MGLIDDNGTVCDLIDGCWERQYKGPGENPKGLWYNKSNYKNKIIKKLKINIKRNNFNNSNLWIKLKN